MNLFNNKTFKYTLGLIIVTELLSFLSFFIFDINLWLFGVTALLALIFTIKNLEYGIWIIVAELIIGSQGYIFSAEFGGMEISFRIALWLIVMSVWLANVVKKREILFFKSRFFKSYFVFGLVIAWGILWGIARGNGFAAIFLDVNNYFFFALVFPFYEILFINGKFKNLTKVAMAAYIWLITKTLILFYIFSHSFFILQEQIYDWSRLKLLAEITNISVTASRIFMQSQIWLVLGFFILLGCLFYLAYNNIQKSESKNSTSKIILLLILTLSSIIVSFSRSFWAALILTTILFLIFLIVLLKEKTKLAASFGAIVCGIAVLSIGITIGIAAFPIPQGSNSGSLIRDRATSFGDAAASTRWAILKPLSLGIVKHPIIGSGFGSNITYKTQDPRALQNNPDGLYTTTAFEWGYLDMIYKFGLAGLIVYLYLIIKIIRMILEKIKSLPKQSKDLYLLYGALFALIAVALTHGASPYLNHPLGIGIIILLTVLVDKQDRKQKI